MKTYIKPNTEIVVIETQHMIAESTPVTLSNERQDPGSLGASREGRGFWDDEDEY